MKALVMGCGSIGVRHIFHLKQLGLTQVEATDPNPQAGERAKASCQVVVYSNPEEALAKRPDVVLVCTPAATHIPMTIKALEAGAHVFVEKPLSISLDGVDSLMEKARLDGRVVQVGYNLRYHPAMRLAKEILESGRLGKILTGHAEFGLYLKKWWPDRDYRKSYMVESRLSGGLLLDASHEIDLLIWFMGPIKEVVSCGDKLSDLDMKGLDVIKVLMRMESRALASLHIDCLQPTYTRGFTLVGEDSALRWDCADGRADKSLGRLWAYDSAKGRYEEIPIHGNSGETYLEELRDFLDSVTAGRPPQVGLKHGVEVLRVIAAIQKAIQNSSAVPV